MKQEMTPFGKAFNEIRKSRGLTIRQTAELLGVSPAYISAVDYGKREIPMTWKDLIVEAFGLDSGEKERLFKAYYGTPPINPLSKKDMERCLMTFVENVSETDKEKEAMLAKLNKFLDSITK